MNGIKNDNRLSNLEVITQKENIARYWENKGRKVVAVSIPKKIYDEAEAESKSLSISRSKLYTEALKNYMHIKD